MQSSTSTDFWIYQSDPEMGFLFLFFKNKIYSIFFKNNLHLPRYWNWVCNNKLRENSLVYLEGALPGGISLLWSGVKKFHRRSPKGYSRAYPSRLESGEPRVTISWKISWKLLVSLEQRPSKGSFHTLNLVYWYIRSKGWFFLGIRQVYKTWYLPQSHTMCFFFFIFVMLKIWWNLPQKWQNWSKLH